MYDSDPTHQRERENEAVVRESLQRRGKKLDALQSASEAIEHLGEKVVENIREVVEPKPVAPPKPISDQKLIMLCDSWGVRLERHDLCYYLMGRDDKRFVLSHDKVSDFSVLLEKGVEPRQIREYIERLIETPLYEIQFTSVEPVDASARIIKQVNEAVKSALDNVMSPANEVASPRKRMTETVRDDRLTPTNENFASGSWTPQCMIGSKVDKEREETELELECLRVFGMNISELRSRITPGIKSALQHR